MNDVMVDLETMGTGPNAAIIAIGAVEFDLTQGNVGDRFYAVVSLESSVTNGGIMEPSTVMWWLGQSDDARKAVRADGEHINVALLRFATWLGQCAPRDDLRLWGNGAGFDNVVLEEAYRRSQLTRPWHFWNNRCYRTMKGLQPDVKAVRAGTHHNALDDALTQARHLIAIMQLRPTANGAGDQSSAATLIPTQELTDASRDVLAERARQVSAEDWTPEHDDGHPNDEIAAFAAVYAMPPAARDWPASETGYGDTFGAALCPADWAPKFGDRRRELVKAGALIVAEIERLDRADKAIAALTGSEK